MTVTDIEIIRETERYRLTGLSRVTWWRLEKIGKAPKRIQLAENSVGWLKHEVLAWLERQAGRPIGNRLTETAEAGSAP